MYETYWHLQEKPFEPTGSSRFYYPSETHQGTLLKLRYALENRRPGALLAGDAGTGKTMLYRLLVDQLPETLAPRLHWVFPRMPADQMLAMLARQLMGIVAEPTVPPIETSLCLIEAALGENAAAGRHALLAIDEAHLLGSADALETLRLLLNFQIEGDSPMSLILLGQPGLLPIVDRLPALEQRLAVKCFLRPLSLEETMGYVAHRMKTAGATRDIFEDSALEALHQAARGIPRRIDRLADLALLIGFAEQSERIDAGQIESIAEDLTQPVD